MNPNSSRSPENLVPHEKTNLAPPKVAGRSYRILHTEASLGWGGQERRILAEAQAMRSRGHRLSFACDPRGELFPRARRQGFEVTPLRFGRWHNLLAWLELRLLLRRQAVDVLNTHSSLDSWVGGLAWQTLRRGPLWVRTRHLSTPVKNAWPTRWLYLTPAAIITTGQSTKELLRQRLKIPARRIFSIPTGVSPADFRPREKDRDLLRRGEVPDGAFVFGSVAVLRSWKGHLYLLEAFQNLLQQGAQAFLLIVGDGPYRGVIEEKIAQLGIQSRVRLLGYQEEVAGWFALMDAVVLASYANEGVPQSTLQAMAMAKPVVGTAVGGIPEVVVEGETGLLAPPRDAPALARAMARLLADPAYGRELGRRGRELVLARFSLEEMAAQVEAVYEAVREPDRAG